MKKTFATAVLLFALAPHAEAQEGAGDRQWERAGLGGAPVEALAVSSDGRGVAIAGLAGIYLSLDGGTSWTRDARVDPLDMKCGPMDVMFGDQGLLRFRCVAPSPPKTRCLLLPLHGAPGERCPDGDTRTEPPGREAKRMAPEVEGKMRRRLDIPVGSPLPVVLHPGLDGLAAVRITPDVSGKVEAVFVDFAVPLADFLVHEGDPWVRAGQARCVNHREGWRCAWVTLPGRERPRRTGAVPVPEDPARSVKGVPSRPIFAAHPQRGRPASLVGTSRGLYIRR